MHQNEKEGADKILFLYLPTSTITASLEGQTVAEFFEEFQKNSKNIWFLQPVPSTTTH